MATEATKPKPANDAVKSREEDPQIEVREEKVAEEPQASATSAGPATPRAAKDEPKAAKEEPKPQTKETPEQNEKNSRLGRAEAIIRRHMLWSMGAGVVPVPIFDLVAVSGVQLKMLAELSELYGFAFRADIAKKLLGSLFSSAIGVGAGTALALSFSQIIPVVGTALGMVSVPVLAGAFTHATGKVFVMHFEAGGTLLDFDPHVMRSYFKKEFERGKETVAKVAEEQKAKVSRSN